MAKLGNPKRERFCSEYVIDLNATQAALRAGYSARTAEQQGNRLLGYAEVQRRIAELQKGIEKRAEVNADWVVAELVKIAKADIRKFYNDDGTLKSIKDLDDETAAALASIEVETLGNSPFPIGVRKIKRWDRPKVLELLGKHFGLWPQKIQHDVNLFEGMSLDDIRALRSDIEMVARAKGEDLARRGPTRH